MKIRPSILLLCAAVVILIILALWFKKKPIVPPLIVTNPAQVSDTNQPITLPKKRAFNNPVSKGTSEVAKVMEEYRQGLLNKAQALTTLNDIPITFYGRLQDQFGNGVAGGTINFAIQVVSGQESTTKRGDVTSDANGFFTITGYKGQNLAITLRKAGYTLATTSTLFWYSHLEAHPFVPDQNNPTVIKMWKLQGAEPLVGIDKTYKLHYTAAPINFDLLTGQIVPSGGDIQITVNRPAGVISGRNPQNWSIQIEVIDGGFIVTSWGEAQTTYSAPESGYESSGTFGNNNGPGAVDQMFFIQSRNGQVYSKVHLLFGINKTPDGFMYVTFRGVANTNSSRNWEATAPL